MTEQKFTLSKSELENLIEQKVQEKLKQQNKTNTEKQTGSRDLDRRQFMKKAGLGTVTLAALGLAPASALNINTDQLSLNTGSDTDNLTENFSINTDGDVEIPNGNVNMTDNNILNVNDLEADKINGEDTGDLGGADDEMILGAYPSHLSQSALNGFAQDGDLMDDLVERGDAMWSIA